MLTYHVTSALAGKWKPGDHITAAELEGIDVDRLLSIGAIEASYSSVPEMDGTAPEDYEDAIILASELELFAPSFLQKLATELGVPVVPKTKDKLIESIKAARKSRVHLDKLAKAKKLLDEDLKQGAGSVQPASALNNDFTNGADGQPAAPQDTDPGETPTGGEVDALAEPPVANPTPQTPEA